MSILLADNFDIYDVDAAGNANMKRGFYLQLGSDFGIGDGDTAPRVVGWDLTGKRWLEIADRGAGYRRSLGGSFSALGFVTRFYMVFMPSANNRTWPFMLRDGSDNVVATVSVTPDGNLQVINSSSVVVAQTTTPCIVLNTAHKMQLQMTLHATLGEVEVRIDNVAVIGGDSGINGENLVLPGTATQIAQYVSNAASVGAGGFYVDYMVPYSLTGTYNSDWPLISGVATLLPNSVPVDTWTPRPRQMFGAGVLRVPGSGSLLDCGTSANFNLGSGDYTLETTYRHTSPVTTTNFATLLGKWSASTSQRSYRLVKYGPDINNGELRFEITTDGTLGTLVTVLAADFQFVIGHQYHIAVSRTAGVTRLFIDGRQIGLEIADANTYFASGTNSKFTVGGEISGTGTSVLANSSVNAQFDECRITVGVGRYTTNFSPPTDKFPRNIGGDPDFASVQLLFGLDEAVVDESTTATKTIAVRGSASRQEWSDAAASYLTLSTRNEIDDRFLEAAFLPAQNVLQLTDLPADTETVVLGAQTYTFKTALTPTVGEVLIGADVVESLQNLMDAINGGPGSGTTYAAGLTPNVAAGAVLGPTASDLTATAYIAGVVGNTITSTETLADGSWLDGATLTGGQDIPAATEFGMTPLPAQVTGLRALFLVDLSYVEADFATVQKSLVVDGMAADGADNSMTSTPTYRGDVIEEDPDTGAALTPVSVINGRIRLNRTS